MFFFKLLLSILLPLGWSLQLSLHKAGNETTAPILFDSSRGLSFCFPTEQIMGMVADGTMHRNWGLSVSWNYTIALQRVGQVICRQLRFSYGSMESVELEETRSKITWTASCLGYEPALSHCVYAEVVDHAQICRNFVGLRCHHCNTIYHLRRGEIIKLNSPGYPLIYNDDISCEWQIVADYAAPMAIKIWHLALPERDVFGSCTKGYLAIGAKKDHSKYIENSTLCGKVKDTVIIFEDSILSLRLHSGLFHPRPNDHAGFNLTVTFLEESTEGEFWSKDGVFLRPVEIVGIILGIFAALMILYTLSLLIKQQMEKKRRLRRQQTMAQTLQLKIHPATPRLRIPPRSSLPAIPVTGGTLSSGERSGIYEEAITRNSASYLRLDDLANTAAPEQTDERYNFNIPDIVLTSYSDLKERSSSVRTDDSMFLSSIPSDLDSVFSDKSLCDPQNSDNQGADGVASRVRYVTYTIAPNNQKERRSSSPFLQSSYWNIRKQELSQVSEQRRSSEPNIKIGEAPPKRSSRLGTFKFSTARLSA